MRCRALALGRITPKPLSCMPLLLRLLGIRSPEPGSRSTGRMLLRAEPLANVCPSRCSQWEGVLLLTLECLDLCVTDACVPGAPISFSVWSLSCRRPAAPAAEVAPLEDGTPGGWHLPPAAPCSSHLSGKELLQDVILHEQTCPITSLGDMHPVPLQQPLLLPLSPLCYS